MSRRRALYSNISNLASISSFDIDPSSSFLIRREIDSVEQIFTYTEVIDGTYDAFISGTNGGVLEWDSSGGTMVATDPTLARLFSNSGQPYIYCYNQYTGLKYDFSELDLSGDYIVTSIQDVEQFGGNGRVNFIFRGTGNLSVAFQQRLDGNGFLYFDKVINPSVGYPADESVPFSNTARRLYTISRINGVKQIRLNNVVKTFDPTPTNGAYSGNDNADNNSLRVNSNGAGGKINKYSHFSVVTGDSATALDISAYNQSIMAKYNL